MRIYNSLPRQHNSGVLDRFSAIPSHMESYRIMFETEVKPPHYVLTPVWVGPCTCTVYSSAQYTSVTMESPGHRPATAGTHSARRNNESSNDSDIADDRYRPPARPSTQRSTNTSPRTEQVASGAGQSGRRGSGGGTALAAGDFGEKARSEIAALRQKLSDGEFAKIQAQVRDGE